MSLLLYRSRLRYSLLALGLLTAAMPALAFDTWWFWGGEVHEIKLITEPLAQFGVKQDRIKRISDGANSQDIQGSKNFTDSPQNHFDDDKIKKGSAYVQERMNAAMILAREAWKTPAPAVVDKETCVGMALYALGQGLHTAQDFYCHTDYLELLLRNKQPLVPVDYTKIPPEVHSGYFYWAGQFDNEGTAMPKTPSVVQDHEPIVMQLVAFRREMIVKIRQMSGSDGTLSLQNDFHTDTDFQRRWQEPGCDGALAYVTDGTKLLHFECAKDNPNSLQGRIITPGGETLYAKALQLAKAATVQQWLLFEKMIREDPDQARFAAWNLAALKGLPFPKLKILSIEPKTTISSKDKIAGIAKIQLMNVDALFADKTKPCKLQIKVAGTLNKGFQRGEYTVGQETGGVGDGIYDIPLDKLNLSAPDERGEVTLKLEAALADDPTPYAEFGTFPLTVEMSPPAVIPQGTPNGWVLNKVVVDFQNIVKDDEKLDERFKKHWKIEAMSISGEHQAPPGEKNDGPKMQVSMTFAGKIPQTLRPGTKFDITMITKADPPKNISGTCGIIGCVESRDLAVTKTPADAWPGAGMGSFGPDRLPTPFDPGGRMITYHCEVPKDLNPLKQSNISFWLANLSIYHYGATNLPAGGATGATPPSPLTGQPGAPTPKGSSVTTVSGEVGVRSDSGGTLDVKAGAVLPAGEAVEIRTGSSGTISVRMPLGGTLIVEGGSVVRIEADGSVKLIQGSVNGDTDSKSGSRQIEVTTPAAQITDDGTKFTVSHDPIKGVTTVAVAEGSVRIQPARSGAPAIRVEAGERIEVPGPDKPHPSNPASQPPLSGKPSTPPERKAPAVINKPAPIPALTLRTPSVKCGETLAVVHSAFPASRKAWIALYKKGVASENYVCYTFLANLADRVYDVTAPEEPGLYEFRLFLDAGYVPAAVSDAVEVKDR